MALFPEPRSLPQKGLPAIHRAVFALLAIAAVPLFAFAAIRSESISPIAFAFVHLGSGATTLALLAGRSRLHASRSRSTEVGRPLALLVHTCLFPTAFLFVGPALGAMVLLGSIQLTRLAVSVWRGPRPPALAWLGSGVIAGGMMGLVGSTASLVTILSMAAMSIAGVAWTAYTSPDRDTEDSLATNAHRHVRAVVFAIPVVLSFPNPFALTPLGVALAVTSGVIASGLGYAVWDGVGQRLGVARAAFAQLAVPTLTALGAVTILGEPFPLPTAAAAAVVLGGTALALAAKHGRAG